MLSEGQHAMLGELAEFAVQVHYSFGTHGCKDQPCVLRRQGLCPKLGQAPIECLKASGVVGLQLVPWSDFITVKDYGPLLCWATAEFLSLLPELKFEPKV